MPVQSNIGIQTAGQVNDPTNGHDLRFWTRFAWSFTINTTLAQDTTYVFEYAEPSDADPCVPGDWEPVPEIATCQEPAYSNEAPEQASITLPAGTEAGQVCSATIPCRPGAFVRMRHQGPGGNPGSVDAVILLQGPKMGRDQNMNPYANAYIGSGFPN